MKKILMLVLFLILALPFTAYAGNWTSSSKIGVGKFNYTETGDSDAGTNYSLSQRFNYHEGLFMLSLKGVLDYVPANYTGATMGGTAITGNTAYTLSDFSAGAGIDKSFFRSTNELYLSLGELNHSFMAANSSFSNGGAGYDENYQVKYLNLTYKNIYPINDVISNVFKISYLKGLSGTATTKHFSNVNFEFNLSAEAGYCVTEGLRYKLNSKWSITGDVYYSALFFSHSNENEIFYEPSSMTHETGLQTGLNYNF